MATDKNIIRKKKIIPKKITKSIEKYKRPYIDYWYEFIMTFTNKKSLFSSKKIERFIVFWTFLVVTMVYMYLNIRTLDSWDFVEISALWLAYGGYNSLMNLRDKKLSNNSQGLDSQGLDQPDLPDDSSN